MVRFSNELHIVHVSTKQHVPSLAGKLQVPDQLATIRECHMISHDTVK